MRPGCADSGSSVPRNRSSEFCTAPGRRQVFRGFSALFHPAPVPLAARQEDRKEHAGNRDRHRWCRVLAGPKHRCSRLHPIPARIQSRLPWAPRLKRIVASNSPCRPAAPGMHRIRRDSSPESASRRPPWSYPHFPLAELLLHAPRTRPAGAPAHIRSADFLTRDEAEQHFCPKLKLPDRRRATCKAANSSMRHYLSNLSDL